MGNLANDEKRFVNFLKILPEKRVYKFLHEELWNGEYRDMYNAILEEYKKYRETILSEFQNPKINKANKDFDVVFKNLFSFLVQHFFRSNPNFDMISLYPEHRNSTEEKRNFWDKKLGELKILCDKFEEKYKNFITTAYEELSKNQENSVSDANKNITEKIEGKSSASIEEIICAEPNNKDSNTFNLVINNKHIVSVDGGRKCWNLLTKVAEEKFVDYEVYHKGDLDNLNTNKKNKIYTKTGYKLTKILKVEGGQIVPNIKLELISRATFKRRLKKFGLKKT